MHEGASMDERITAELDSMAEEVAGVTAGSVGPDRTYAVGRIVFAVHAGDAVAFRLKPDIAQATLKTPRTRPSARGSEWVEFAPGPEPDQYDLDRLSSWFEMAYRLAKRH
jgi:hypothetical protein